MRKITLLISLILISFSLYSAEVTDVADAFDPENPFDFNLGVALNNMHLYGNINRDYNSGQAIDTDSRRVRTTEYKGNLELSYRSELLISGEFGLYHNLSLTLEMPVVLKNQYSLERQSSNLMDASGNDLDSLSTNGFFPGGNLSYNHKGVGDISAGFKWAPFDQERNKDVFSWLLGFKVTFPTADIATPEGLNEVDESGLFVESGVDGAVGKGLYILNFQTAFAKRYSISEPYFKIDFNIPVPSGSSLYDKPQFNWGVNFGSEFVPMEDGNGNRIKFITDFGMRYFTAGNSYNVITDARWVYDNYTDQELQDLRGWNADNAADREKSMLPWEDAYMQLMLTLQTKIRIVSYVELGGYVSIGYMTDHFLTAAENGDNGYIPGLDDEKTVTDSIDSDYGATTETSGGRLSISRGILFGWGFNLTLRF